MLPDPPILSSLLNVNAHIKQTTQILCQFRMIETSKTISKNLKQHVRNVRLIETKQKVGSYCDG